MSRDCPPKTTLAILGFAASAGVSPPDLLHASGLDPAVLSDPDTYLLLGEELRLWDEAIRLTGDQDLGIHLAEWVSRAPEDHFDVLAFATRICPTLGEHYRMAGRYMRLIHEGVYLSVEEEGDVARLVHGHHPERIGPRQPVEGMLSLALLLGRRSTGDDLAPQAVCFSHDRPPRVSEHERVFRAPVHFGCPRNELLLARAALARPQRHAEQGLLSILDAQLGSALSRLPGNRRFRDLVVQKMMEELPEREPNVPTIAAKLQMSPRSLQRRLRSERVSFADVLADLRRDLAVRYLQDPRISIGEVAFLLGFLDVTAFHRAFKRWTGSTPAEHRRGPNRGAPQPAR